MKNHKISMRLWISHPTADLSRYRDALGTGVDEWTLVRNGDAQFSKQFPHRAVGQYTLSRYAITLSAKVDAYLDTVLIDCLARLMPHRELLRENSADGGENVFFVGWFCDGHTASGIGWQVSEALADLRVRLDLHVYVPDETPPPTDSVVIDQ